MIAFARAIAVLIFAVTTSSGTLQHWPLMLSDDLVRICTANGVYYVSLSELTGEENNAPQMPPQACHAICLTERNKSVPKPKPSP